MSLRRFVPCSLLTLALGCEPATRRNDWSVYTGPGADYFQREEVECPYVPDPLEPTNRVSWAVNDFLLFDLFAPVADVWRFLVPQPVRTCLVNASHNITFPIRFVSNLLQGEVEDAGEETRRFLVNSTAGVLGLFDVAGGGDFDGVDEDVGRAFVTWGWKDSTYLVLPLAGPRTTRDTVGLAADYALDPTTYVYWGVGKTFIVGSEQVEPAKRFVRTNYDPYSLARLAWISTRQPPERNAPAVAQDPFADEVLRWLYFQYQDPWFPAKARTHRVRLPSTGRKLAYELWLQPEPAPMVFIIPGMGAHRRSKAAIAAAELAYGHGFSVVVISSVMSFDFLETGSTAWVPGYPPVDAHDAHVALDAIHHDLTRRYPDRVTARILLGLSLGAFHTVYIATAETDRKNTLIDFDRYVALSPPVDLRYAVERLDTFYNVPLALPADQRAARIEEVLAKAARAGLDFAGHRTRTVSFSRDEAEFLVGLSFRWTLHDVIWQTQLRHNMGVLKTPLRPLQRAPASREILEYSYLEYFYAFVLPYYQQRDPQAPTAEQMFAATDLRNLSARFPPAGKIRVFANENDFLVAPEHLRWLVGMFGEENVHLEPTGGHLGVFYDPASREKIMQAMEYPQ